MAPQTNSSVTGSQWLVFGTAVASSSHCYPVHQHLINVSRQCCRIVIFIVFVFVILRNVNDVFLY